MQHESGKPTVIVRAFRFYRDGFRTLTPVSRKLWLIIGVKLFVMFAILRAFFFPNVVKQEAERQRVSRSEFVEEQLIERRANLPTDTLPPDCLDSITQ